MSNERDELLEELRSFLRRQRRRAAISAGFGGGCFVLLLVCVRWHLARHGSPWLGGLAIGAMIGLAVPFSVTAYNGHVSKRIRILEADRR